MEENMKNKNLSFSPCAVHNIVFYVCEYFLRCGKPEE